MKKTPSIVPLIEKWETFNKAHTEKGMYEFAAWLLAEKQQLEVSSGDSSAKETRGNTTEVAILVTRLYRYLGLCAGPQVKKLGFTKEHEYNFLYQVSKMNRPNKNDLSKENMMELSTGRDIIRRLKVKGLVEEKKDPHDRRAMLITITPKGKGLLKKSFTMMAESFMDFLGPLTVTEQERLIGLLKALNHYHALKNKKDMLPYL
jgi:DNA-binding MarR family transcriptional regulator